ncbi:hypothetical protein F4818DRAFT_385896 [Hypoxylon cercidicola]|nr:hypothetical protein F4818DRAFT_385896 [Hypoxylon cercidicola]
MEALQRARARMEESRQSAFEKLPKEMKGGVLAYCDVTSAMNLALTGPVLYDYVKGDEAWIATNILTAHVGMDLMPLAVAKYLAEKMHLREAMHHEAEDAVQITSFVDTVLRPDLKTFNPTRVTFTIKMAAQFLSFHSSVTYYTNRLAARAILQGPLFENAKYVPRYIQSLADRELRRFMRVLYILQLSYYLFPRGGSPPEHYEELSPLGSACARFWTSFAPWEQQQVRCAQEMMHTHIARTLTSLDPSLDPSLNPNSFMTAFLLGYFVVHKGLEAIMRDESRCALLESVRDFSRDMSHPANYRRESYDDKPWLKTSPNGNHVNLFQEEDPGPRDAWLSTLQAPLRNPPFPCN